MWKQSSHKLKRLTNVFLPHAQISTNYMALKEFASFIKSTSACCDIYLQSAFKNCLSFCELRGIRVCDTFGTPLMRTDSQMHQHQRGICLQPIRCLPTDSWLWLLQSKHAAFQNNLISMPFKGPRTIRKCNEFCEADLRTHDSFCSPGLLTVRDRCAATQTLTAAHGRHAFTLLRLLV